MNEIVTRGRAAAGAGLAERLGAIVGPAGLITDGDLMAAFVEERRKRVAGRAAAVVRPACTAEVAAVVKLCAETGTPIVPQGGNTGLVIGSTPDQSGREVVLSLARMNRIRAVDPVNATLTAEAGCILADVQNAAAAADRLFPLSLAAEGSCTIGGNLSTNAGGTQVLRYGSARDLVLGLEVVLADGQVLDALRGLRKDNTGYDLKQLFLGAEGTLGIITAAVLKLYPNPREVVTAWAAVRDARAAVDLLTLAQDMTGGQVTAFEYLERLCLEMVIKHMPGQRDPLERAYPAYVLIEVGAGHRQGLQSQVEAALAEGVERGLVLDATIAASEAQAAALWRIREEMPEAQRREGAAVSHDTSVPISQIGAFMEQATARIAAAVPGARFNAFGHIGDGNIHFNILKPEGEDDARHLARGAAINRIVEDVALGLGGSFSAEHGVGTLKKGSLARYKSPVEIALMRRLKATLDPLGILNPGRIL